MDTENVDVEIDPALAGAMEDMMRASGASRPRGEPRHSLLAEEMLVADLTGSPELVPMARGLVKYGDFYSKAHGLVFHALCKLHDRGAAVDEVSVIEALQRAKVLRAAGDADAVRMAFLSGSVGSGLATTALSVETNAKRIAEYATARRIGRKAVEMHAKSQDWSVSVADLLADMRSAEADAARNAPTAPRIAEGADLWVERFEARAEERESPGLTTGFPSLDGVLLGLQGGDLVILAARPSIGKTALALAISLRLAWVNEPVLFVSLEMPRDALMSRAVSMASRVPFAVVRAPNKHTPVETVNRVGRVARQMTSLPLYVCDESSLTINELTAAVRAEHARRQVKLVVVDYAQLVKPNERSESREREVREVADGLKALAKSINVPVLALAQLNRDVEKKQREPVLADLRESGALEQNADVVMFLHSDVDNSQLDAMRARPVDLIFRKVRAGARDLKVPLDWTPGLVRYSDPCDVEGAL
jgi:replicative DNA helicase